MLKFYVNLKFPLSGELQPDSGDFLISGRPIFGVGQTTKQSIGFCPQFNPLYKDLTVKTHLHIFAAIGGGKGWGNVRKIAEMVRRLRERERSQGLVLVSDNT